MSQANINLTSATQLADFSNFSAIKWLPPFTAHKGPSSSPMEMDAAREDLRMFYLELFLVKPWFKKKGPLFGCTDDDEEEEEDAKARNSETPRTKNEKISITWLKLLSGDAWVSLSLY